MRESENFTSFEEIRHEPKPEPWVSSFKRVIQPVKNMIDELVCQKVLASDNVISFVDIYDDLLNDSVLSYKRTYYVNRNIYENPGMPRLTEKEINQYYADMENVFGKPIEKIKKSEEPEKPGKLKDRDFINLDELIEEYQPEQRKTEHMPQRKTISYTDGNKTGKQFLIVETAK